MSMMPARDRSARHGVMFPQLLSPTERSTCNRLDRRSLRRTAQNDIAEGLAELDEQLGDPLPDWFEEFEPLEHVSADNHGVFDASDVEVECDFDDFYDLVDGDLDEVFTH